MQWVFEKVQSSWPIVYRCDVESDEELLTIFLGPALVDMALLTPSKPVVVLANLDDVERAGDRVDRDRAGSHRQLPHGSPRRARLDRNQPVYRHPSRPAGVERVHVTRALGGFADSDCIICRGSFYRGLSTPGLTEHSASSTSASRPRYPRQPDTSPKPQVVREAW